MGKCYNMVVRLVSVFLKVGFEVYIIVQTWLRALLVKLKNKYIVFMHLSMYFFGRVGLQGELDNKFIPIPGN